MLDKARIRSLKMAAGRSKQFKNKLLWILATGALFSFALAGAVAWGGYHLLKGASVQIRQAAATAETINVESCLGAITEMSTPGYWLDSSIRKSFDETLARCSGNKLEPCQGDACLNPGHRVKEVET